MTTAKKNVKNLILQGEHDKGGGNMAKGITVFYWEDIFLQIVDKLSKYLIIRILFWNSYKIVAIWKYVCNDFIRSTKFDTTNEVDLEFELKLL